MVDITHKQNTLRIAVAEAVVTVSSEDTILAIKEGTVPKGDVFVMSKAAGLLGVKKTPDLLPDCHPLPIEYAGIDYHIDGLSITVTMTVKTIYKTGVEVEAMHGASVVALNMYDMLKPIDKGVEIGRIRLVSKKGGKSSFKVANAGKLTAAVIVCSDRITAGTAIDRSGQRIAERLNQFGLQVGGVQVVADEKNLIQDRVKTAVATNDIVVITGGTGLAKRDVTPEAVTPMLDRRISGIEETMRAFGQQRMPFAMLSRSVAGMIGDSLILALPGSEKGVVECMDAIFPHVLHIFKLKEPNPHG